MKKSTAGRLTGFVAALGVTAGLVGVGVNMTGAYFQDTESARMSATTGEVDASVDANTPLSQAFGPLMPGQPGDTNTYSVKNVGTGNADLYLASANWSENGNPANAGATNVGDVVTLNSTNAPTSWEWADVPTLVKDGDQVSFQWKSTDVSCAGGVPRMFIRGGAYNTFDADPAGPGACGTGPDGDGWRTVTGTISGIGSTPVRAGHTGVVNDATASDPGTIEFRNITIGGNAVSSSSFDMCHPDNRDLRVKVQSATHNTGTLDLCNLPAGPILFATNVAPNSFRNVDVTLSLDGAAGNEWANRTGTADLIVIATQAGAAPTAQADQTGNDAA